MIFGYCVFFSQAAEEPNAARAVRHWLTNVSVTLAASLVAPLHGRIAHALLSQDTYARQQPPDRVGVGPRASGRTRASANGHQSDFRGENAVPGEVAQQHGANGTRAPRHHWCDARVFAAR